MRTKAMKSLSEVVAVDPSILARVSVGQFLHFLSQMTCLAAALIDLSQARQPWQTLHCSLQLSERHLNYEGVFICFVCYCSNCASRAEHF